MKEHRRAVFPGLLCLFILLSACAGGKEVSTAAPQPTIPPQSTAEPESELAFSDSGTALLSIPSLNGNQIQVRITKPEGDGPFPALIGVAGGNGYFANTPVMTSGLQEMGIVAVDFAPQGRGGSEGQDDFHGPVHQDDLKALVDFIAGQPFVQPDNIGILSFSYGVVLATGALSRHPDMPVAFLIDWEGPSSPGRDLTRGLENGEAWASNLILYFSGKSEMSQEEMESFVIYGGAISDEAYWADRDAARFAADLPCPYLRVQFDVDHAQGVYKYHMMEIVNAATEKSGQWTRCNDNPPNVIYDEEDLADYHFHTYDDGTVDTVLLGYVDEMFFTRPYEG
jgi:alpha-beta hydrolase superfamily lysophospholipase